MYTNFNDLLRTLPEKADIFQKLASGEYTLWGGVVRHAKGAIVDGVKVGGQIIGHLILPSDPNAAQQSIQSLQAAIQQSLGEVNQGIGNIQQGVQALSQGQSAIQSSLGVLQGLQTANLVMAGLNLAVSIGGFIIVCNKLNSISSKIDVQTKMISEVHDVVKEIWTDSILAREAEFMGTLATLQHFARANDLEHMKHCLKPLNQLYHHSKLALQRFSEDPALSLKLLDYIAALQERHINLGLTIAYLQAKTSESKFAQETLKNLEQEINELCHSRIENLTENDEVIYSLTIEKKDNFKKFMGSTRNAIPLIRYNCNLLEIEEKYPGIINEAANSEEILFIAA